MKFSTILVSVNIAATIPLTVASTAHAAEPVKSDNSNWLKSSLASMDTSVNQKKPAGHAAKFSLSKPMADTAGAVTIHSNGLKMRPFVANRRLPSQRDLDVQLIRQTAKMAANETLQAQMPKYAPAPQPLVGNVSEVYATLGDSMQQPVSNYGNVGYVKQSSSRVAPGQVPAVQGQIRQFRSAKRTRYVAPQQAEGNGQQQMSPQQQQTPEQAPIELPPPQMAQQQFGMQQQQFAMQQQQFGMQQQQFGMPSESLQPPVLPAEEQAIIDRMVDSTHPHMFGEAVAPEGQQMMSAAAGPSAGPAPFPLNLLPQDSLKQVIGGMRRTRCDAPASYFGSWHGSNQMSSLPTAGGFARYAPSHTMRFGSYHKANHASAPSAGYSHNAAIHHADARPQETTTRSIAQVRRLQPHDPAIASYASYARLSGGGY